MYSIIYYCSINATTSNALETYASTNFETLTLQVMECTEYHKLLAYLPDSNSRMRIERKVLDRMIEYGIELTSVEAVEILFVFVSTLITSSQEMRKEEKEEEEEEDVFERDQYLLGSVVHLIKHEDAGVLFQV